MFRIGLNPYGLSYAVGLQGLGTPRVNPSPIGLEGFIAVARGAGVQCIELDHRWLTPMTPGSLARLADAIAGMTPVCSFWLSQKPGETLADAVRCATAIGAPIVRLHLTPVLEGARSKCGPRWSEMIAHARAVLRVESRRAADAGLVIALENHQDLGSEELVALAEEMGEHVGVTFDTGNAFAVGEEPVAFARRAAHRIRHVHLKDYVAQFTDEGYKLVRCAIGDGCVPFDDIAEALNERDVNASIEPGALEARHIRLFTPEWWQGYPPRLASELGTALGRLQRNRLNDDADCRTPWEAMAAPAAIVDYEMGQIRRSIENVSRW